MSYPVTLSEEDFELFRIARILGKRRLLELLKECRSKNIAIDDLLSFVKGGVKTEGEERGKEALSFVIGIIRQKFPEVKIPPKLAGYAPPGKLGEKIHEAKKEVARRAKRGEITPLADYTLPILEALIEMGGSGRVQNVLDRVFTKMKNRLKPKDLEKLPSGTFIRWKNKAQWQRLILKDQGYLKRDSPRGIWEITDEGRKLYKDLKEK